VHRPALEVDDPAVHVPNGDRLERCFHAVEIALPERGAGGARYLTTDPP
jgi:hypothetical protein